MPNGADAGDATYVEIASPDDFTRTLQRLEQTIEAAGLTIFARIDHAAAARGVGLTMPATTVLVYGNPRGGTPVMLAGPHLALDLPLRVLVREGGSGQVFIGWHPIAAVLKGADVADDLVAGLAGAQTLLAKDVRS